MSSNGLWKVTSQPPSIMGHYGLSLSSGKSPRCSPKLSQDEPIDFSQKSEPTPPSDASFANDGGIRKKFKTETGAALQNARNAYLSDNRGYAALDQCYYRRNEEPSARQQDGTLNGLEKNGHERDEQNHFRTRNSSPRVDNGNLFPYHGAITPASCPLSDVSSSRSPRSPEADARRANMSSPETASQMANGREQLGSPEANVNGMDVCNGGGVGPLQVNEHLPNFMVPSTSSNVAHSARNSASLFPAGMLKDRRLSNLPNLTIPIMNPMNVRKSNGSSPGMSTGAATVPFRVMLSPPTNAYENQMKGLQMPNPWPVVSSYVQTSILQAQLEDKKSMKHIRPFKAYSSNIIATCHPGVKAASVGLASSTNIDQYLKLHSDYYDNLSKNALQADSKKVNVPEPSTTSDTIKYDCQSTTSTTNGRGETSSSPEIKGNESNDSSLSPRNEESQQQSSSDNGNGRKRGNRYPDAEKDPAYWERRKKNNEAAKRSRDARRRKEDALAETAKELLEEKIKLSMHLSYQMREAKKLEDENRFLKEREVQLKNYVYHLENRCRDCSSCNKNNPDTRPV